jgi:hypothetical protein
MGRPSGSPCPLKHLWEVKSDRCRGALNRRYQSTSAFLPACRDWSLLFIASKLLWGGEACHDVPNPYTTHSPVKGRTTQHSLWHRSTRPAHLPCATQNRYRGVENTIGASARDAVRFFKCQPNRFITDLIDDAHVHHPIGQQLHGPASMPQRGWSTRNGDEMGFHTPIDLASQRSLFGIVSAERSREAQLHKALFDADDGAGTDFQRFGDLATGGRLLVAFVGFEQHACCHLLMGR